MSCDQPFVDDVLLRKLIKVHQAGHQFVAATYANGYGLPLLVDKVLYKDLMKVHDHESFEILLLIYSAYSVPFPLGTIDINTEEDWKHFFRLSRR